MIVNMVRKILSNKKEKICFSDDEIGKDTKNLEIYADEITCCHLGKNSKNLKLYAGKVDGGDMLYKAENGEIYANKIDGRSLFGKGENNFVASREVRVHNIGKESKKSKLIATSLCAESILDHSYRCEIYTNKLKSYWDEEEPIESLLNRAVSSCVYCNGKAKVESLLTDAEHSLVSFRDVEITKTALENSYNSWILAKRCKIRCYTSEPNAKGSGIIADCVEIEENLEKGYPGIIVIGRKIKGNKKVDCIKVSSRLFYKGKFDNKRRKAEKAILERIKKYIENMSIPDDSEEEQISLNDFSPLALYGMELLDKRKIHSYRDFLKLIRKINEPYPIQF